MRPDVPGFGVQPEGRLQTFHCRVQLRTMVTEKEFVVVEKRRQRTDAYQVPR